jgi:hypothetical protein
VVVSGYVSEPVKDITGSVAIVKPKDYGSAAGRDARRIDMLRSDDRGFSVASMILVNEFGGAAGTEVSLSNSIIQ